jgi:hypothetical protein
MVMLISLQEQEHRRSLHKVTVHYGVCPDEVWRLWSSENLSHLNKDLKQAAHSELVYRSYPTLFLIVSDHNEIVALLFRVCVSSRKRRASEYDRQQAHNLRRQPHLTGSALLTGRR